MHGVFVGSAVLFIVMAIFYPAELFLKIGGILAICLYVALTLISPYLSAALFLVFLFAAFFMDVPMDKRAFRKRTAIALMITLPAAGYVLERLFFQS